MWIEILLFLGLIFLYIYHKVTKQFDYFEKKGVPFAKPSFPYGSSNSKKLFNQQITFMEEVKDLVESDEKLAKEKIFGYFTLGQPQWVINGDEELAKRIFIKDFDHFTDIRSIHTEGRTKNQKLMGAMFFNLKGEEWRKMRSLVSNIFSSGKMKMMAPYMVKVGNNIEKHVESQTKKGEYINIKNIAMDGALDVIGSAGFGLETDSFANPDSLFRKMAYTSNNHPEYSKHQMLRIMLVMVLPKVANWLDISFIPAEPLKYFSELIEKTYRQRVASGQRRNDVIDLLVDEIEKVKKDDPVAAGRYKSDDDVLTVLVANALVFFLAGLDTIAFGMSFVVHQLVEHPELQEKVYEDIMDAIGDEDGEVEYDKINEMKYLDLFVNEALRFQEIMNHAERMCTKDYKIPGTDFVIEKGRFVKCYVRPFTYSAEMWANPDNFDPENFEKDNFKNKFGFQSFGQGPRACIGMRFGILTLKLQTIFLLRKFRLKKCEKTMDKLESDPDGLLTLKPLIVEAERRN